ncbi:MAG: hypothetical protein WCG87_02695 [Bacteroidota bacterium]
MQKLTKNNLLIFLFLWLLLFVIYFPAAKAGLVGDFPGWIDQVSNRSFLHYINRSDSNINSLYQFTQLMTWIFYHLFGTHAWPWHVLNITMHSINGLLIFIICKQLFTDSGIENAASISMIGVLLYCVCPHISEVIVWEPAYHFLQGLMLILLIMRCVQLFHHTPKTRYFIVAVVLFLVSTYSLEVFYLTPFFTLTMAIYYRYALNYNKALFRRVILYFFIPQIVLFVAHLIILRIVYPSGIAHIGELSFSMEMFFKFPEYLFHIICFGRYFPHDIKEKIYHHLESIKFLMIFYSILCIICVYIIVKIKKMSQRARAASFMFVCLLFSMALIIPVWLQKEFIVVADRYTYVMDVFIDMLMSVLMSFISIRFIRWNLWLVYALINVYCTTTVVKFWKQSAVIINNLLDTFPYDASRRIVLLNLPQCLKGVPMIHSDPDGQFLLMYNMLQNKHITTPVYDGLSFNMTSTMDGAHVTVMNDSLIHVTLNQWGTWWWYGFFGALNYENRDYKIEIKDPGHWYELILKRPASEYLLLYMVDGQWKKVDMNHKNEDQN